MSLCLTINPKYILNNLLVDYNIIFAHQLKHQGAFEECYALSIHKAGSTLMHKMIAETCNIAKVPAISIPDTLFKEGIFEKDWGDDKEIVKLIGPGRIYYGFRNLPNVLLDGTVNLKSRKCVLLIRDPRDALVSQYFSFGGKHISHKLPDKNADVFLSHANSTAGLDIDDYVLQLAKNHLNKLINYKDNLDFNNVLLRKYEEIYFDKKGFLSDIFDHYGISVDSDIISYVAERNDVRPAKENINNHIRKGKPGDHKEKLKPDTIGKLNDIFNEVCAWYGYDLS